MIMLKEMILIHRMQRCPCRKTLKHCIFPCQKTTKLGFMFACFAFRGSYLSVYPYTNLHLPQLT